MSFALALGNSECSFQVEMDREEGKLPLNDYKKMCRAYNEYCRMTNEVWSSSLTSKSKRSLDTMIFEAYMKRALDLDIEMEYRTRLQNVISSKRKEALKLHGLG